MIEETAQAASPLRKGARSGRAVDIALVLLLAACLFGLSLPWVVATLARRDDAVGTITWLLDLAAHWQQIYALGWVLLLTIWCLRRRPHRLQWLPVLLVAGLPWLSASPPLSELRTSNAVEARMLRLSVANVHVANREPARLLRWFAQTRSDVLVVLELSPTYAQALDAALPDYPYRALYPLANSAFGLGIYSRRPLHDVVAVPDADGILTLGATLDVDARPIRLIAAHPMPPAAPRWHAARDRLLRGLAQGRHPSAGSWRHARFAPPLLVAGDINATPWSSALHVAADVGLRRSTGLSATWPMAWGGHVGIPIDHVLANAHWRTVSWRRGPDIGGDHAPIMVELRLHMLAK